MLASKGDYEILSSQFIGKKVFLNLSGSNVTSAKIKRFLSECGAHLTEFLDKSVDAIIVDKRMHREKLSIPSNASQSRAFLMMNATSGKVKLGSSAFEEISKRWNIPIYDSKMLLKGWQLQHRNFKVQRIAHKTSKVKKLKAPFIKVEDRSHKYKVDFVEMQTVPFLDLDSEGTKSPFETWYLENVPKRSQKKCIPTATCELCQGTYHDLDSHLVSARHTAAANDESRFEGIDRLIACGTTFEEFKKKTEERAKLLNK